MKKGGGGGVWILNAEHTYLQKYREYPMEVEIKIMLDQYTSI